MKKTTRFAALLALALLAVAKAPEAKAARIFGFDHVDLRNVQEAQAPRHSRAARARHDLVRIGLRRPDAGRLASWGNPPLLTVERAYLGRGNFTGFREAWCADALRAWLRQSGHSIAGTDHRAISFALYGRATSPHVGALAVLRHHVGIVAGFVSCASGRRTPERAPDKCRVVLLSGNHGRRVGLGAYSARRIIAFREPI